MRFLLAVCVILLVAVAVVPANAVDCHLNTCNFSVVCNGRAFDLTWSYTNTCAEAPLFKVEYQACPNGAWLLAGDDIPGTSFSFIPVATGINASYRVKLTIKCQGCTCTGPVCEVMTQNCISCP